MYLLATIPALFIIAYVIAPMFALTKIFKDNRVDHRLAFIPIVNNFFLFKMVGVTPIAGVLLLIPNLNLIVYFLLLFNLSKKYGKEVEFSIGLFFLPFIYFFKLAEEKPKNEHYVFWPQISLPQQ